MKTFAASADCKMCSGVKDLKHPISVQQPPINEGSRGTSPQVMVPNQMSQQRW